MEMVWASWGAEMGKEWRLRRLGRRTALGPTVFRGESSPFALPRLAGASSFIAAMSETSSPPPPSARKVA